MSATNIDKKHDPEVIQTAVPASIGQGITMEKKTAARDIDDALLFVQEHQVPPLTPEENRKLLKKIDRILLPILIAMYTLSFMDKQAMAYSANFGLMADEHIDTFHYAWASNSIPYLAILVFQPLAGRLLQVFPIGKFMSVSIVLWGAILMATAATTSFASLGALRFLLGMFESPISPFLIIVTSQWWTRKEQPARAGYWFISNAIGQVLGGLIGYGIGHINRSGGGGNWIYYFIIFGAITICVGITLWFVLPSNPMDARWLSMHERAQAVERVRSNRTGMINHIWKWEQFRECIRDPKTFMLFSALVLNTIPSGGVASFGNIVIKGFGFSSLNTTLLQMPLGIVQCISLLIGGAFTSNFKNVRCHVMSISQIPALIGACLLVTLPQSNKGGRLAAYYIIQTHTVSYVMAYSLLSGNYSGFTKKTTAGALIFIASSAGQIIGPQLFKANQAPGYHSAFAAAISCFALLTVLPYVIMGYLIWENKRRDKKYGKVEDVVTGENEPEPEFDDGLHDKTDWQQTSFRYVY